MAQRRPITDHPAFAPLVALWFAALFGLGLAVLPAALVERALQGVGLGALVPLTLAVRIGLSAGAALLGGLLGIALGRSLGRHARHDPRPLYDEGEPDLPEPDTDLPARRPLRVREELEEGLGAGGEDAAAQAGLASVAGEGFMILSPQPVHPPRPAPDLEELLAQFDHALDSFRAPDGPAPTGSDAGPDPVHAFVARQTGTPAPGHVLARLGDAMPDHQAELRAALDKLAEAQRRGDG